jgi:serine/threonine protein kinase
MIEKKEQQNQTATDNNSQNPNTAISTSTKSTLTSNLNQRQNERIIGRYGKYATLIKNEKTQEVFIRHTFPKNDPHSNWRASRAVEATKISSRHINVAMPLLATKHKNGDVDVEVEFADAGSLAMHIKLIREKFNELNKDIKQAIINEDENKVKILKEELHEAKLHQIQMAKSVARQLIDYCFYLDTVLGRVHKNLNPETVLFRKDGCVKTTFLNYLDKDYIKANRCHFIDFNAYVAPELTTTGLYITISPTKSASSTKNELNALINTINALFRESTQRSLDVAAQERINNPTIKSDIWSIGAILYSIMIAINFMPNWHYCEPEIIVAKNSEDQSSDVQNNGSRQQNKKTTVDYEKEQKIQVIKFTSFLEFVKHATIEQWTETFGNDPFLTYIARRCLNINASERATITELHAFIYLAGGFVSADETQLCNLENQSKLNLIKREKLFEKISAPDAYGRKYKFTATFAQVGDAFSTERSCLSSSESVPLNKVNHGESILKEMKPFNETRFGKIYRQKYCEDNSITDKNILSKDNFAFDDIIDPELCIFFPQKDDEREIHVKAWVASPKIKMSDSILSLSIFLHLESHSFRSRRNKGNTDNNYIYVIEKMRREITRGRQKIAWIVLGRAILFFSDEYTKK